MDNNFDPKVFNNNKNGDNNSQNNNVNSSFIPKLPIDNNQKNGYDLNLGTGGDGQNNGENSSSSTQFVDEVNKNNNPYRDYLPENRSGDGFNFSPKLLKFGLGMFWVAVICVVCLIGVKYFYGVDVLKVKSRNYNLNLTETINLDNIYSSPDVVWESDSDNVTIKNNVVFANKTGSAYILGRIGNQQVSDVKINVLAEDAALSLENHSVSLSVGESAKIKVNQSSEEIQSSNNDSGSVSSSNNDNLNSNDVGSSYDDADEDYNEEDEYDGNENLLDDEEGVDIDKVISEGANSTTGDDSDITNDEENSTTGDDSVTSNGKENSIIDDAPEKSDKDLEYKSSDDSIAKVDNEGNITPVSPGTVIITVKDNEGNTDHTYVTVEEDDLIISNSEYTLNVNDEVIVQYGVKGNNYQTSDVVWTSNNLDVCSVTPQGRLFGVGKGEATIIAKLGDKIQKTVHVKVVQNEVLPNSLEVSFNNLNLVIGESKKVVATVLPKETLNNIVYYVSSNSNVASVDNQGNIIGKSVGNAVITVSTMNGIKENINVTVNKKEVHVDKVYFKESSINLEVDKTVKLNYVIEPSSASDKTVQFNYDKNMVSIDENGNLKAIKAGTTSVELISSNGIKSVLEVKIISNSSVDVKKINLSDTKINMEIGDTKRISYTISPSNATNKEIKYIYDNSIVSISSTGIIKALKEGKTIVSLQSSNGVVSSMTVVVNSPKEIIESLSIKGGNFTISTGGTKELEATVVGKNISSTKVWSSSNTNVLEVDSTGKVIAKNAGEAVVTVKMGEKLSNVKVKVVQSKVKVTSIEVNKSAITIKMGSKEKLIASVKPSNATNKGITWKSDDISIVNVNSDGIITGISKGQTTVNVYSNDDKNVIKKIRITVTGAASSNKLSSLENANSYKGLRVIKTLTANNLKQEIVIPRDGSYVIGQGFTVTPKYYVAAIVDCVRTSGTTGCPSKNTKILFYSRSSKKLVKSFKKPLGHANGLTANPNTKEIYVTRTPAPYSFSYENVKSKNSISPGQVNSLKSDKHTKAIAYDKVTDQYYLMRGTKIFIYNSKFELIKKFSAVRSTNQDCAAYKGLLLCVKYPSSKNIQNNVNGSIDIYRISDNSYLGTVNVSMMNVRCKSTKTRYCGIEIEGLDYLEGNKFALYYNYTSHSRVGSIAKAAAIIYTTSDLPIG